jgi:hypothetical protein
MSYERYFGGFAGHNADRRLWAVCGHSRWISARIFCHCITMGADLLKRRPALSNRNRAAIWRSAVLSRRLQMCSTAKLPCPMNAGVTLIPY